MARRAVAYSVRDITAAAWLAIGCLGVGLGCNGSPVPGSSASDGAPGDSTAQEAGGACVPGASVACAGPGGCSGHQVCNAAGSAFELCSCLVDGGFADAPSGSNAEGGNEAPDAPSGSNAEGGNEAPAGDASSEAAQPIDAASFSDAGNPCSGDAGLILQGSFTITNAIDVATLAAYCEVTGDLTIDAPGITSISLPNLALVDGSFATSTDVDGGAPDLATLQLPSLVRVGNLAIDVPSLTEFGATRLEIAGTPSAGGLSIIAPALTSLSLPSLAGGGSIAFSTPQISTVTLQALQVAGAISLGGNGMSSPNLSLPTLTGATDISFVYSAAFPNCASLEAPLLTTATSLQIGAFGCSLNFPLLRTCPMVGVGYSTPVTSLRLPSLSSTQLWVSGTIQSLDLSGLETLAAPSGPCSTSDDSGCALYVAAGAMPSLSLPATQVTGGVFVGNENELGSTLQQDLSLPAVTSISGVTFVNGSFSAPNLTQIGGDATFGGATNLPALATIGGTLGPYGPESALALPALQRVGNIGFFSSGSLTTVTLPLLTTVAGTFNIDSDLSLTTMTMPKLASVGAGDDGILEFSHDPNFPQACAQLLFNQAVANGFGGTLSAVGLPAGGCAY